MRYKAIAVDIDGTIMNHGKEMISPLLYKTFLTCKEKGLKLVVVTSRSLKEMEPIHQELLDLFDYKVYSTGGIVFDKNTCIRKHTLTRKDLETLIQHLDQKDILYSYSKLDGVFYYSRQASENQAKKYESLFGHGYPIEALKENVEVLDFLYFIDDHQENEVLNYIHDTTELCDFKIHGQVKPKGINKGYGVSETASLMGLSTKDFIVFGDGTNDVSMFNVAGVSVAMGNASDEVKGFANEVCLPVEKDGVAHYLIDLLRRIEND
ncbi:HAD family hydrolase [Anaerorhabdus furcosa]|uniref:Cof subfamily of IIB subfamily of haloacid dehalogenase superfamily/HAD-superfamily hydrolase, subfamily IIB n=1 Tax=Anaerorhabdus furcosa TaxID=118967 RepID=A0A1T4MVU0_9FIRM|nr:HAD family hydrolase [Anaerorhabdus furcosa]SJZ71122.1 Cof subfamily of IIB subfamily of haloacid dehalogenase superfamily/HAD-superfamily hydrolase, subfamily IIB [Anaerorhabdus furcosa]